MLFNFGIKKKKVKELRKNQGLTAQELAVHVGVDNVEILKVDDMQLKDVPEPLKSKIMPVLKGEHFDNYPW